MAAVNVGHPPSAIRHGAGVNMTRCGKIVDDEPEPVSRHLGLRLPAGY